jgi:hypothetical protein
MNKPSLVGKTILMVLLGTEHHCFYSDNYDVYFFTDYGYTFFTWNGLNTYFKVLDEY